jgi:demethoxyubiquinone hydroxylase (CLK1/Coq7/Cat5 family)
MGHVHPRSNVNFRYVRPLFILNYFKNNSFSAGNYTSQIGIKNLFGLKKLEPLENFISHHFTLRWAASDTNKSFTRLNHN